MSLLTVSGQPGCRFEEAGRVAAQQLGFEFVSLSRLESLIAEEFDQTVPERAFADGANSVLARLALERHLVVCGAGAEMLLASVPDSLRVRVAAPESVRAGNVMVDRRMERAAAREWIRETDQITRQLVAGRYGPKAAAQQHVDLTLNARNLPPDAVTDLIVRAALHLNLDERGFLEPAAEAQLQFQARMRLAKHGIAPRVRERMPDKQFAHPSERVFANLLDFYRIAWEYEPRTFPIEWDAAGAVTESFSPDFYLPECELYVELTTMKQSLVTRKNRKVKRLRELYPDVKVQIFYQKDFEHLVFKYGLAGRILQT